MNCVQAEKTILLQDSGELGAAATQRLEMHLAGCASCRQFRQILIRAGDTFDAGDEPSGKVVQNVLRETRKSVPAHRQPPVLGWKPALAMAASVLIALGLFLGNHNANRIGIEMDVTEAQLLTLEDQVVSIMYEGLSEEDLAFNFLMTYVEDMEG